MTQFLDTPVDKSLGVTGAWTDIDLSANVPTTATGAIFQVRNTHATNGYQFGLQKKGSTDNRYKHIWNGAHMFCVTSLDANRKCQGKIEATTVDFYLVGYTESDATLFTNAYNKSQSTTGAWTDLDLSSELPAGAVAAIFQIENVHATSAKSWSLRKKGSTDDRYGSLGKISQIYAIIGVDANRKCQFKIESTDVDFYLLGYLSSGEAETNGVDRSLGSTGSYIDITESGAPAGATGAFIDITSTDVTYKYAARKKGASGDIYDYVAEKKAAIFVGLDTNKKWEGKISNTGVDFYTLGYFAAGVTLETKESSIGLSIQETPTKESTIGLSIQETPTKESTIGVTITEADTNWLYGYAYRNAGAAKSTTAGAQTNYQVELKVGESSGASGADVHCNNKCDDFPNDIRFTKEDGITKHDYWVDISTLSGSGPNRLVTVTIEVSSFPASGAVAFYIYYGKTSDSSESEGDNTFVLFDDFDYNFKWEHLGNSGCESLEVVGDYVYYPFSSSPAVVKKYNKSDLSYVASLTLSNNDIESMCTDGSSYLYVGQQAGKIAKVSLASFTESDVLTLTQGSSVVAGLYITGNYLYAGRGGNMLARILLSDFSTVNYLTMTAGTGYAEPGASDGTYLYVPGDDTPNLAKVNKVKLSDFTLHSSITLTKEEGQQNPIIDNGYLYVACEGTNWNGALVKIDLSTFTETSALVFTGKGRIKNVFKSGAYIYSPSYTANHGYWHKIAINTFTVAQECDMGKYRPAEAERLIGDYLYFGIDAGTTWADCYLGKMHLDDFSAEEGPWEDNKDPFDKWIEYNTPTIDWSEEDRLRLKDDGEVVTVDKYGPNIKIQTRQHSGEQDCKWLEISGNPYDAQNRISYYSTDGAEHNGNYDELATITEVSDVPELHYTDGQDDIRAWNIYKITWALSHVIFYQNGNLVYDHTANIIQNSNHIFIKAWDSSVDADPKIDADWISISKYVSPEPTLGYFGSEQYFVGKYSSIGLQVVTQRTKASSIGLLVGGANTKESTIGLSIQETPTKESTIGMTITDQKTNTSSIGLLVGGANTKASSIGLSVQETKTKTSSIGLSVQETKTKESSIGLSVQETKTKESSIGMTVMDQKTKESSIGMTVMDQKTKTSSIGLFVEGANTKESSIGLSIQETPTKESSIGITIQKILTVESSISMTLIARKTKTSSIGLFVEGANTKESSIGLHVQGDNIKTSSLGVTIIEPILKKGFFYAKLGDTALYGIIEDSFRISKEINRTPSFEFEISNCDENRTAINTGGGINKDFKIYWQHHGVDTLWFTGVINADGIEYVSLDSIRITGFASYVKLSWPLFKHLANEDAEPVNKAFTYDGGYTDFTTAANNATINDVICDMSVVNYAFYIGDLQPFLGAQIKYSTKGVRTGEGAVIIEYSKGSGVWATLDVLDESDAFTEDPGTYNLIIPHLPSDWDRNTVNGEKKYWLRYRVDSVGYTTNPLLDQIHIVNVDIYRTYYFDTPANEILTDVLEGTDYTESLTHPCPTDVISIVAEYESPLRIVAAIPNALTWTAPDGSKKAYHWWIDDNDEVHIAKERGEEHEADITGEMTIFNNHEDYFNLSNQIIGLGPRDGAGQMRAIVRDTDSIETYKLREIAVSESQIGKYQMLKNSLEKKIAISKEPMQRIRGSVSTQFWGLQGFEVGDSVWLHQEKWHVSEKAFQIVKVDIGPTITTLDLGIGQEHLEGLRDNLQRQLRLNNVQMHGSTTILEAGPETHNYQRVSAETVYPAKLEIAIPSTVKKIHKVLLSWTLGPYRASVGPNTGEVPAHDHDGYVGNGGGLDGFNAGAGGAFTPGVDADGGFIPQMIGGLHSHLTETNIIITFNTVDCKVLDQGIISGSNHRHEKGRTGPPDDVGNAIVHLNIGSACPIGSCVASWDNESFAESNHWHYNTGLYTGYSAPTLTIDAWDAALITGLNTYAFSETSNQESPVHDHDGVAVDNHGHAGIDEPAHADHAIPAVPKHGDHPITSAAGGSLTLDYDIYEEAGGTDMELLVNGESVGIYTTSPQTEIRIDGWLNSGNNTVALQPKVGENNKKGGATLSASGLLFVEPIKF